MNELNKSYTYSVANDIIILRTLTATAKLDVIVTAVSRKKGTIRELKEKFIDQSDSQ